VITALRSSFFNACFFGVCMLFGLATALALPLPRRATQWSFRLWVRAVLWLSRVVAGLDYEVRGEEHIPAGGAVFASKHQSAWDVGIFHVVTEDPAYVLKKELLLIPFYGWTLRKAAMIDIDRAGGASELKRMVRKAGQALAWGRGIIIFPQGTRIAPGERRPYHPGVAALYARTSAPVVPVALNSGYFWGRRSFLKYPGVITIEFLPPMPEGLDRRSFMAELEARIETASERLTREAAAKYPRRVAGALEP
jgi:1-acyl-sn-glycerol-3-phosphate acyltransferase